MTTSNYAQRRRRTIELVRVEESLENPIVQGCHMLSTYMRRELERREDACWAIGGKARVSHRLYHGFANPCMYLKKTRPRPKKAEE